jgi:hypothetical protein
LELLKIEYIKERHHISGALHPLYGKPLSDITKLKLRKPKSITIGMGIYERTLDIRELSSKNRKGKGIGERNAMASPENRAKVGASKIGRKLAVHNITGQRKLIYPNAIPDGFILK